MTARITVPPATPTAAVAALTELHRILLFHPVDPDGEPDETSLTGVCLMFAGGSLVVEITDPGQLTLRVDRQGSVPRRRGDAQQDVSGLGPWSAYLGSSNSGRWTITDVDGSVTGCQIALAVNHVDHLLQWHARGGELLAGRVITD